MFGLDASTTAGYLVASGIVCRNVRDGLPTSRCERSRRPRPGLFLIILLITEYMIIIILDRAHGLRPMPQVSGCATSGRDRTTHDVCASNGCTTCFVAGARWKTRAEHAGTEQGKPVREDTPRVHRNLQAEVSRMQAPQARAWRAAAARGKDLHFRYMHYSLSLSRQHSRHRRLAV